MEEEAKGTVAMCQHCKKELSPDHIGPCPYCGKVGKDVKVTASVVIKPYVSAKVTHEGLRKDEKKDSGNRYLEQFDRVKRCYEEFKLIDQGRPHDHSSDFYQDQVYAFFQNCWHLKEWIKNDSDELYKELNGKIHCDTHMLICRDICNGTKHLKLKNKKVAPQFEQKNSE